MNPEQIIEFIGSNFDKKKDADNIEDTQYTLTVHDLLSAFRDFDPCSSCNVARLEWHWCDHQPFLGVKLPKENAPRHQVWTWQLIKRVLRAPRVGKTKEMQDAFHIALRTGMRLAEVLSAPENFDPARRVVTIKTKTEARAQIPIGRIAAGLLLRTPFTVGPNEGSVLFSKLCRELLIDDLTFHDARSSALTWMSRRVDVMTLARISRHRDLKILMAHYYRETPDQIAARI